MSLPFRVTLQGFSKFERSALASCFRLAAKRNPAYQQVDSADEAHFIVVDADHADVVRAVVASGRTGDTVFVGAAAPQGASAWVMRPIDPLHVLRELDAMVAHKVAARAAQAAQHGPPAAPGAPARRTGTVIKQLPVPGPVPTRRASDAEDIGHVAFVAASESRLPAAPAPPRRGNRALLVDDSEIALRFLETRLLRLGLKTECTSSSAKAIELLSHRHYDFIFLDVELGDGSELDGLALCQHIKRQHHHVGGGRDPVIVMVSAHHSELDRVRGTLAGADAYVGKPLDETLLAQLLQQHGLMPPASSANEAAEIV
jgi:CheY-like chemotaxis protein